MKSVRKKFNDHATYESICDLQWNGHLLSSYKFMTYIPTIFFHSQLTSVNLESNRLLHEIVRVKNCEIHANPIY